ncbi:MAG: DNA cytosine methyltransferase [Desulfobacterales bacterium]|nr:DNA cytosine methyltransferase [Desulfobacterales bacterium]
MIQQTLFPAEHISKPSWFMDALEALGIEEISGWPDVFGTAFIKKQTNGSLDDIRVLSLFSGGGGLDIGFHDAGFKIVEANELVQDFAATLSRNSTPMGRLHGAFMSIYEHLWDAPS